MKKYFVLSFIVLAVGGCMYQPPMIISQPPGPYATVVTPPSQAIGAVPGTPLSIWVPDPTAGIIQNTSRNVFLKIWLDSKPPNPPTLELGPEQAMAVNLFLNSHYWYAEGRIFVPSYNCWASVGTASGQFEIKNWSYTYGTAWRLYIGDGNFPR